MWLVVLSTLVLKSNSCFSGHFFFNRRIDVDNGDKKLGWRKELALLCLVSCDFLFSVEDLLCFIDSQHTNELSSEKYMKTLGDGTLS